MWTNVFTFFGYIPTNGITGSPGNSLITILINYQSFFPQSSCTFVQFDQQYMKTPIFSHIVNTCYHLSLILANLVHMM